MGPFPWAHLLPLEALRAAVRGEPLGLYLHVPFCRDRCTYCSFVATRDLSLRAPVLAKLEADLAVWGEALGHPRVDTLYLGGGTPSLLDPAELRALLDAARGAFELSALEEATLEANPGTLDLPWLERVRELGFDRISLGVQTLEDGLLACLGRIHNAAGAMAALEWAARAGFSRRSADLLVGVPGQRPQRVLEDARRLVATGLEHLSIYLLDLDKPCPLRARIQSGRLLAPSEDEVADAFEALQEELPRLGLWPYEISNYARPGAESRHNLRYWERRPYLGLGPGAASQMANLRWSESSALRAWLEGGGVPEVQELDAGQALAEIPLLGLRMHRGVDWAALRALAASQGLAPLVEAWEEGLERFFSAGLLVREGDILRLTPKGMLLSNAVFQTFV